jgi:uncharacterized protein YecE (DUF72 family)
MATLRVGTTSFGDRSLIRCGRFYPPSVKSSEARLRYFASRFPIVEIDSTYYAIPAPRVAERWVERTPEGFVFDVKAFRLFTQHRTPIAALPSDLRAGLEGENVYFDKLPDELREELWTRFRALVEPLRAADKLGVVLLQFAPWFVFGPPALRHLERCAGALDGLEIAVEMRNKSWFGDKHRVETLDFERSLGLVHVVVDEPQGSSFCVPQVWAATHPELAVVRLHGRNESTWEDKSLASASERFDHLYSERELGELALSIERLARAAPDVHVLFNNCHDDNAQRNALALRRMLADDQPELAMHPW